MVYWIGFALWIIGLAGFLWIVKEDKQIWKWIFYLVTLAGLTCYSVGAGIDKKAEIYKALTKEVNLQQVVVQGQNGFRAQVQIVYKDGKLDSITLVPKTTVVSKIVEPKAEATK